jgi:hypothetical protein
VSQHEGHSQIAGHVGHTSPPAVITEEEWVRVHDAVGRHTEEIKSHAEDIDTLKHGRTALLAVGAFISFLLGVVCAVAAILALKQ